MRNEYPKPTVSQSIEAWRLMLDLIDIGYPHNFQAERSDLRDFCYDVSSLIKRAYAIVGESEVESEELITEVIGTIHDNPELIGGETNE